MENVIEQNEENKTLPTFNPPKNVGAVGTRRAVNMESKSNLAKLLAQENLTVFHDPKAQTASFEIKSRRLTLPTWKNMSRETYDLFVSHEVGHALFTGEFWKDLDLDKIPQLATIFNIVEDARIEKLIKAKFPGFKTSYIEAYADLYDKGFFGPVENLTNEKLNFLDRLNIYFKVGSKAGIVFADGKETEFVYRMTNMRTYLDAIQITKELAEFVKDLLKNAEQGKGEPKKSKSQESNDDSDSSMSSSKAKTSDDSEDDDSDDSEDSDSEDSDSEDSDSEDDDSDDGDSEDSDSEDSDDGDSEDSDDGDSEDGDSEDSDDGDSEDSDDGDSEDGDSDGNSEDSEDSDEDGDSDWEIPENMMPKTQQEFDNQRNAIPIDSNAKASYEVKIPLMKQKELDKNVIWGKTIIQANSNKIKTFMSDFIKFRNERNPMINYLVKEFNMHQKALTDIRTRIEKKGTLNTKAIYRYKTSEDVFVSREIAPIGKNHALMLFIDFSTSMESNLKYTIEQLLDLSLFCEKIQIPFEVYAFTTHRNSVSHGHKFQTKNSNEISYNNQMLDMYQIISCKMNRMERNAALALLLKFSKNPSDGRMWQSNSMQETYSLGLTPIAESVIVCQTLMENFKKSTRAEKIHLIYLTDGGHNGAELNNTAFKGMDPYTSGSSYDMMVNDEITGIKYQLKDYNNQIALLFDMIRDRFGSKILGFFLSNNAPVYFNQLGFYYNVSAQNQKTFSEQGCMAIDKDPYGYYDELYIANPEFKEKGTHKISAKLILEKFIKQIA